MRLAAVHLLHGLLQRVHLLCELAWELKCLEGNEDGEIRVEAFLNADFVPLRAVDDSNSPYFPR